MTKDEKAAKLLRIFPVLKGGKQKKAFAWLKANGYLRGSLPPNTQAYAVEGPPGRGRLERMPMSLELLGSSGEGLGYYDPLGAGPGTAGCVITDGSGSGGPEQFGDACESSEGSLSCPGPV